MYFILTAYRLKLTTNLDLSGATSLTIKYSGPFYTSGEWTATADGKTAYYDISDTLIDRTGIYKMQLVAVIDGQTKRTNIISATFEKPL